MEAPWRAFLTDGQVASGEATVTTLEVHRAASLAADRPMARYRSVSSPTGPTTMTTFGGCVAAAAGAAFPRRETTIRTPMVAARSRCNDLVIVIPALQAWEAGGEPSAPPQPCCGCGSVVREAGPLALA